jgi:hypothetical protein
MTLSSGQALARAHTPALVPLRENREAAAERLGATTLRAVRRASITGTFVTAKSGGKAALPGPAATGGRPVMHHPRRRLEKRHLPGGSRSRLLRGHLQQVVQPDILRPQPRKLRLDRRREISHAHTLSTPRQPRRPQWSSGQAVARREAA